MKSDYNFLHLMLTSNKGPWGSTTDKASRIPPIRRPTTCAACNFIYYSRKARIGNNNWSVSNKSSPYCRSVTIYSNHLSQLLPSAHLDER